MTDPLQPTVRAMKIGQQRRRTIHMKETNQQYTWIPFEHCVCVWNNVMRPNLHFPESANRFYLGQAELPVQFARNINVPVQLSEIARFIQRVILVDHPPVAETRITLLTQEVCPARKRWWHPIDIIGSFKDETLAQQEAELRTTKSNICIYRALTVDLYVPT